MNRKEGDTIVNKKSLVLVFLFVLLLVGCLGGPGKLTRIDVRVMDDRIDEDMHIQDADKINLINDIMKEVDWDPNTNIDMAREEDVLTTFFFDYDKQMPERLIEYRIWWNQSKGSAIIVSSDEDEGYGKLDKGSSELEKQLMEDFVNNKID